MSVERTVLREKEIDALKAVVVGTGFRPSDDPAYPTFRDGHVENVLADAVALSNRKRRWVEVLK